MAGESGGGNGKTGRGDSRAGDSLVHKDIVSLPSRNSSNFTNLISLRRDRGGAQGAGATIEGGQTNVHGKSIAWGTTSTQADIETYIATNDRAKLPHDQVIGTEKVNILLKHFYGLGEKQAVSSPSFYIPSSSSLEKKKKSLCGPLIFINR